MGCRNSTTPWNPGRARHSNGFMQRRDNRLGLVRIASNDHPVIPQNLYRMSGGANNNERFEQIGQSWLKHAFAALNTGRLRLRLQRRGRHSSRVRMLRPLRCQPQSGGPKRDLGSRGWVNPFTGVYPGDSTRLTIIAATCTMASSHRVRVEVDDLNQNLNQGATYFAEAQYVTPHEYAWCQDHPSQCNMYNNVSYREFMVSGTTTFQFFPCR